MTNDRECDTAEQGPTDGPSQKPSVPPMAPFRLCLEEIDAEILRADAMAMREIMAKSPGDTASRFLGARDGLERAKSILLKHIKEKACPA